jgi:hypothetical protein
LIKCEDSEDSEDCKTTKSLFPRNEVKVEINLGFGFLFFTGFEI